MSTIAQAALVSFALSGWLVGGALVYARRRTVRSLRGLHRRWATRRNRFAGTADGAYAEGFSAGLRKAELIVTGSTYKKEA